MELSIKRTNIKEAEILLNIQKEAFAEDLKRYEDHETSPVNEPVEKLIDRIKNYIHYTIWLGDNIIGGFDIHPKEDNRYALSILFIEQKYQNKGLGSKIMKLMEAEFPAAKEWFLYTPHLNIRNQHFYEKLGYEKTGEYSVTEKLTLFKYVKNIAS